MLYTWFIYNLVFLFDSAYKKKITSIIDLAFYFYLPV